MVPPVPQPGEDGSYLLARSIEAQVLPHTLEGALGTFIAAVTWLRRTHGLNLLPAARVRKLFHLRPLGMTTGQLGLNRRPLFADASEWVLRLREVCSEKTLAPLVKHVRGCNEGLPFFFVASNTEAV